ncbi:MAG: BMC domain-containing protein [Enterococcus raffinosus]
MKALGLVETKGLLAAVEASDVMLKTAEVTLTQKEVVGGGLVTIMVQGDVAAVKTAVDAAASAVTKLENLLLATTRGILDQMRVYDCLKLSPKWKSNSKS